MAFSATDIKELLALGKEQSGVEFKRSGSLDDAPFKGKVVRGILAMANRRDGGTVIVGVKEESSTLALEGLSPEQQSTWKHDHLADAIAEYADPRAEFDSYALDVDGHCLLVIGVREFRDVPVICKRALGDDKRSLLRDGAVYVRSNRKPESREIANFDETRELLELATDKGVRSFVARASVGGLVLSTSPRISASDAFMAERGDL